MSRVTVEAWLSEQLHVSRETPSHIATYVALLTRWQAKINLIGPETLPDIWDRHILDSAQLALHLPATKPLHIVDLGSGAGLPGLILALLAPHHRVTLVESDQRKAVFLREAKRQCGGTHGGIYNMTVLNTRIEQLPPQSADVITARAFAPISRLLELAAPHLAAEGGLSLLKGEHYQEELAAAEAIWGFTTRLTPSITNRAGMVVNLSQVSRK